jgi:predicted RNA polymerase sigma factor
VPVQALHDGLTLTVDGVGACPSSVVSGSVTLMAVVAHRPTSPAHPACPHNPAQLSGQLPPAASLPALDHVEDDVLRLMFVCCHPLLTPRNSAR